MEFSEHIMNGQKISDKVCSVCGDRAIGFNYKALTCESCRSFFRRNATRVEEYVCLFGEKCVINDSTRKGCKKCRLDKCISVGMEKNTILSLSGNGRPKKRDRNSLDFTFVINASNDMNSAYEGIDIEKGVKRMTGFENFFGEQSYAVVSSDAVDITNTIAANDLTYASIARPLTEFSAVFNEREGYHMAELCSGAQVFKRAIPSITSHSYDFWDAVNVMARISDEEIRNIVKMSKNLSSFNNICENDQASLIKYSCMEIISMRSVIVYDGLNESWSIPIDGYNAVLLDLKLLKHSDYDLYQPNSRFMRQMCEEWERDETILDLLTAIILFNPNRPNLIHKEMVKLQQHIYMHLLRRYLMLRYRCESEASEKFVKLMATSMAAHELHQNTSRVLLNDHAYISPLIREVCES